MFRLPSVRVLLDVAVSHREDFQGRNEAAMHAEYLSDFCYSLTTFEGTNTLPNIHVVWKMITHIFELDQLYVHSRIHF